MKKTLFGLLALTAVSSASAASYIGGSIGSGGSLFYQSDLSSSSAMRYSLNLNATNFNFNRLSVGGSVDYLADFNANDAALGGLNPYYGIGLGVDVGIGAGSSVSLTPQGTLGLRYNVTEPLSVFVEGSLGVKVTVGAGGGINPGTNARIGLTYRLP